MLRLKPAVFDCYSDWKTVASSEWMIQVEIKTSAPAEKSISVGSPTPGPEKSIFSVSDHCKPEVYNFTPFL